ncbi:MAG: homoserine kinase [Nocardioidaceae bacterium]
MTDERRRAVVRTPATSANLGPGFDSFGLCLGLYDDLAAMVTAGGLHIVVSGEGAGVGELPRDETHLVIRAMRAAFDVLGVSQPGLALTATNRIPHGRGLGSSAAAIVAGLRLAQMLGPESSLTDAAALELAAQLEGHPDNVAACLLGGFTVAWMEGGVPGALRLDVHHDIRATALIPPRPLSTEVARGLLPGTVGHADAATNAARSGLLVAALTGHPALLLTATDDRLHQAYRAAAMPESLSLVEALRTRGLAAVVSGAGPAVLVLSTSAAQHQIADLVPTGWQLAELAIDQQGCTSYAGSVE